MRKLMVLAIGLLFLTFCGCYHSTLSYAINPDGSGKVTIRTLSDDTNAVAEQISNGSQRKKLLLDLVESCKGVEVWKELNCALNADKRLEISGTAYFKDINALKLELGPQNILSPKLKRLPDGKLNLTIDLVAASPKRDIPSAGEYKNLTDEQIFTKAQADYRTLRPLLGLMMDTFQTESRILAPGKVTAFPGLKQEDAVFTISVKGTAILKAIDELAGNKSWLIARAKTKAEDWMDVNTLESFPELSQKLFGVAEMSKLVVEGPFTPVFDYVKETQQAKPDFEKLLNDIRPQPMRVNEEVTEGAITQAQFKKLTPSGSMVRWIDHGIANEPAELWDDDYIISFVGELPVEVLGVTDISFTTAITDTGETLIKEKYKPDLPRDVKINSGNAVTINLKLKRPSTKTKLLKEISGELTVAVDAGLREADVGIVEFKKGAKAKTLGMEITELGADSFDNRRQSMTLSLGMPDFAKDEIFFFDEKSHKLEAEWSTNSYGIDRYQTSYAAKGKFPSQGQIKIRFHKLKLCRIPFKLTNLTVAGQQSE